jgi:hypothetical protein
MHTFVFTYGMPKAYVPDKTPFTCRLQARWFLHA